MSNSGRQTSSGKTLPGLVWAFGGDSITNGSNASNFVYSYSTKAVCAVGGVIARPDFINGGKPGDTSAGLLSRMPNLMAAGAQAFVIMIGTNDAGQSVSVDSYIANIKSIVNFANANNCPVVLCTVPPRGSGTSQTIINYIDAYNSWILNYGATLGVTVADTNSTLVDNTSGYMNASYDSGDHTHPNDTGHYQLSTAVAPAMIRATGVTAPWGIIRTNATAGIQNLITDSLAIAGTTKPSTWFEQPGGTGTAPTYTLVADTSGQLPAGQWCQMDFDGTASGGVRRLATNTFPVANWNVGDTIVIAAHVQIEDTSGTWAADVIAGNASVGVSVINQSAVNIVSPFSRAIGRKDSSGFYDIGPYVFAFTVPAGTTSMDLWFNLVVPTGKHYKMRVGCAGAINATQMGLGNVYNWGTTNKTVNS